MGDDFFIKIFFYLCEFNPNGLQIYISKKEISSYNKSLSTWHYSNLDYFTISFLISYFNLL